MSILINTKIGLPKNCDDCFIECDCPYGQSIDGYYMNNGRPKNCPLIELPPHGRLIDADKLEKKFCSHCDDYMSGKDECKEGCFDLKIIKSIPTVIPADKEKT